jgi:hypothetical protein
LQLTDLIHLVSHIWTPPAKLPGRQTMVIPTLRDTRDGIQSERVAAQCRECAKLLAPHLFVWRKPFPEKATLKQWNKGTISFTGMNIDDFGNFLMAHFTLKTEDAREWLADRSVAALIWNACCDPDSPLPLASWQEETYRKRLEARR